jgi:predicted nuclease with TOPRIM domain
MWLACAIIIVAFWFFRSPMASATADAIRHHNGVRIRDPRLEEGLAHVTEELNQLREQFSELAERVDFTERALAEVRRRDALPNPRS